MSRYLHYITEDTGYINAIGDVRNILKKYNVDEKDFEKIAIIVEECFCDIKEVFNDAKTAKQFMYDNDFELYKAYLNSILGVEL